MSEQLPLRLTRAERAALAIDSNSWDRLLLSIECRHTAANMMFVLREIARARIEIAALRAEVEQLRRERNSLVYSAGQELDPADMRAMEAAGLAILPSRGTVSGRGARRA